MCPWLWGLLCFWDTQNANPPHSPAVGGVGEFVDCCIRHNTAGRGPGACLPAQYCHQKENAPMTTPRGLCALSKAALMLKYHQQLWPSIKAELGQHTVSGFPTGIFLSEGCPKGVWITPPGEKNQNFKFECLK